MANNPDYTFENFEEEVVAEMGESERENAKAIKLRRIELKLENHEDAPSDEETKVQGVDKNILKSNAQAPTQVTASDGANILPPQSKDSSQESLLQPRTRPKVILQTCFF